MIVSLMGLKHEYRCALAEIAERDYGTLLRELRRFHKSFDSQWRTENKPQGLEVNETRIGGLRGRVMSCREALREYLAGKAESVPELEEPLLDLGGESEFTRRHATYNEWAKTFTGGVS